MENFADAVTALGEEGGLSTVDSELTLAHWVAGMLTDVAAREASGVAASRAANRQAELPTLMAAKLAALM